MSIVPPLVNASFTVNPWQLIEGEEGEGLPNLFQSTGAPDALGLDNVYNVPYIKNLVRADVDWIASFAAEDEDFPSIPAYESGWPDFSVINDTFETTSECGADFTPFYLPDFNPDRIMPLFFKHFNAQMGDDDLAKLYKDILQLARPPAITMPLAATIPSPPWKISTLEMNTPGGCFSLPWTSTLTGGLLVT